MNDLKPVLTHRVEFAYKEVFPANDPLARWVANLSRGLNDLLLANRRLEESLETPGPQRAAIYDIKQVAVHAWELAKFLHLNKTKESEALISQLSPKAQASFNKALDALQEPTETPVDGRERQRQRSFRSYLASARDQASHYSQLDHKLLVAALARLGEDENDEASKGSFAFGETHKDFHAEFASLIDYQLFYPVEEDDLEPLKEFVSELREVALALINFCINALWAYAERHQSSLVLKDFTAA